MCHIRGLIKASLASCGAGTAKRSLVEERSALGKAFSIEKLHWIKAEAKTMCLLDLSYKVVVLSLKQKSG